MSVLVKGIDMPKDCVSCRWHARWGCEITGIVTNGAQGCPLVSIPTPHGRLIDGDALESLIYERISDLDYKADAFDILRIVQGMSAIIEAEEGEEDEIDKR